MGVTWTVWVEVAKQRRPAQGVWVPTEAMSTTIEQFRTISLLNVEGKIFFSILSHRLSDYLLENQYTDPSVRLNPQTSGGVTGCRGPKTKSGIRQHPIRARMGDGTVTTASVPGCRWIFRGLERLTTWARMPFKPGESRSLVLKRGKVRDLLYFSIGGSRIPSVTMKPVQSLGKTLDCSLEDAASIRIRATNEQLESWLKTVNKSSQVFS